MTPPTASLSDRLLSLAPKYDMSYADYDTISEAAEALGGQQQGEHPAAAKLAARMKQVRDATHRDSASLRAMVDAALNDYQADKGTPTPPVDTAELLKLADDLTRFCQQAAYQEELIHPDNARRYADRIRSIATGGKNDER